MKYLFICCDSHLKCLLFFSFISGWPDSGYESLEVLMCTKKKKACSVLWLFTEAILSVFLVIARTLKTCLLYISVCFYEDFDMQHLTACCKFSRNSMCGNNVQGISFGTNKRLVIMNTVTGGKVWEPIKAYFILVSASDWHINSEILLSSCIHPQLETVEAHPFFTKEFA